MNGYHHMPMPYIPPNSNANTDDYLNTMSLAEQSFQTPTYSTDDFRRYALHAQGYTKYPTDQLHHF